jgi:hypothetical protein
MALPRDLQDIENQRLAGAVELTGRLVGEEQSGLVYQRRCNGNSLLLATRQCARPVAFAASQSEIVEEAARTLDGIGAAREVTGEGDVLERRQVAPEVVALKDDTYQTPAHAQECIVVQSRERLACDLDRTRARLFETGRDMQQGGLAAARWADQSDELAGFDLQVRAPQRHRLDGTRPENPENITEHERSGGCYRHLKLLAMAR